MPPTSSATLDTSQALRAQLAKLGLHTVAERFEDEADQAAKSESSYTAYLARLVEAELASKADRSVNARIARARFPMLRTLEQFEARWRHYVDHFPDISVWEIGNEVNGGWLGTDVPAKLEYAAQYVKAADPADTTILTLFWQMGTAGGAGSTVFQWARDQISPALAANTDVIALSTWIGGAPLGIAHDEVFERLHAMFPGKRIAMGELGYGEPGTSRVWWWRSRTDPAPIVRAALARHMYLANLSFPWSVGGVFWWYYVTEMSRRQPLWHTVHDAIASVGT